MVNTKQEAIGETQKVTLLTHKARVTSVSCVISFTRRIQLMYNVNLLPKYQLG